MPSLTYDSITIQATYPPGKEQTNTDGILMSLSPAKGNVRMMRKPLLGFGTMVHYLGPDSKTRLAKIRVEKTTFSALETADSAMMSLDGTIANITVTPRTHATMGRTALSINNCLITIADASPAVTSSTLFSREYTVEIEQITPYGV